MGAIAVVVLICGIALAIVLMATRIVLGWISKPAGDWFARAIEATGAMMLKLSIVACGVAIIAFLWFVLTNAPA